MSTGKYVRHARGRTFLGLAAVLAGAIAWVGAGGTSGTSRPEGARGYHYLSVEAADLPGFLEALRAQEVDIAGVDPRRKVVGVVASPTEARWIRNIEGIRVREDLKSQAGAVAPDPEYLNPATLEQTLRRLHETYPSLSRLIRIGKTLEDRPIWALRIGSPDSVHGALAPTSKVALLFNGLHHAREVMTPEVVVDMAEQLLSRYGKDPRVSEWIDQLDLWLVPMVNPDGSARVFEKDPMWRKNARGWLFGTYGVDLNRNYPYDWGGEGSSGRKSAQTYRGKRPLSEPESRAMDELNRRNRFAYSVSYHSFGEVVLYPYSAKGKTTAEDRAFHELARGMAERLVSDTGEGTYGFGKSWEVLYGVNGSDDDAHYARYGTLALTIETNSWPRNFQPRYREWRDREVGIQRPGWEFLLDRALRGPGLLLRTVDARSGLPIQATISIREIALDQGESPRQSNERGLFYHGLEPGEYRVKIESPGRPAVERTYQVGRGRIEDTVELGR